MSYERVKHCIIQYHDEVFDKVEKGHSLLLFKLHLYGVNPRLINWISSLLARKSKPVLADVTKL